MIKQHYTGASRRAMNIIWNGAGEYGFDSPFQAFFPNGDADLYFNLVIGLTYKWLDLWKIAAFFESLGSGNTAEEATAVLWLGIENCIYEKELPERPILSDLRKERAADFYRYQQTLSRQQMMLSSMKVMTQEDVRWSEVQGRKLLTLTPGEKKLAENLRFPGSLGTDDVIRKMTEIARDSFRLRPGKGGSDTMQVAVRGPLRQFARAFMRREQRATDLLILRRGTGIGDPKGAVHLTHNAGEIHTSKDPERDRQYIEEAFGPCMYSAGEMRILENSLCTGDDAYCRLWFTKAGSRTSAATKEGKQLLESQKAQRRSNLDYCQKHIFQIKESIRNLSAQTDTIFQSYLRFVPKRSKRGKLDSSRVYRLPVLGDGNVFLQDSDLTDFSVSVDLLLDASQSRMNSQEMIASQAIIISKSFETCHIPVRVTAFRSLRGYTVLQRLKDYGDTRCEGVFDYYAGGWNRDGLCLKAMEYVMEEERKTEERHRILLVLTDASPNDSVQMPPENGKVFPREYEGEAAVQDAAKAVRSLRNSHVKTAAVYYGSSAHLPALHQIYGQEYTRIQNLSQLSDAVGELLKRSLRSTN